MMSGIQRKILLVLIGVLALTTALNALLASYSTNRQNKESAFTALDRDLNYWQDELQSLTLRLREVALGAAGDPTLSNQLADLIAREISADRMNATADRAEIDRSIAFGKAVSINRLNRELRSGGFSSISVYAGGSLRYYVSSAEAGMAVRRRNGSQVWVKAAVDANGNLPMQSWPAWEEGSPQLLGEGPKPALRQPSVRFAFPTPDNTAIEISIPLQARATDFLSQASGLPQARGYSDVEIAGADGPVSGPADPPPEVFAVLVFRKLIDGAYLQSIAKKTGNLPILVSADGSHLQKHMLLELGVTQLKALQSARPKGSSESLRDTISTAQGSFYVILHPWTFEKQTPFTLGMAQSRAGALQNIRETVAAILMASVPILLLGAALGVFWVRRFLAPILALTSAVKGIAARSRSAEAGSDDPQSARVELRPVVVEAPDEVGELARAFNVMVAELGQAFETLERRVAERTADLALARDAADAANRAKSDFLANMSHEIRTPMNAILGMSYLALESGLNAKQRNYVEKVHAAADSLLRIINDILDFSKIEAGKLEIETIPFHLGNVLDQLANMVGMRAEQKGLELLFVLPPDLPTELLGDPSRLGQILLNLSNNAVKFTDRGEVTVALSLVSREAGRATLRFEVRDSGMGMTPEMRERLFQPFMQADASMSRRYGGTGLGLAICRHLVNCMGGTIGVESEPGSGSTFHFTLPFGLQPGSQPVLQADELQGVRVLVADDHQAARDLVQALLESLGLQAASAANSEAALAEVARADAENRPFQLLLLDWHMPGIDGIECLARLVQRGGHHAPPSVLMVSAFNRDQAESQLRARGLRVATLLPKPVTPSSLLDSCLIALGRRAAHLRHGEQRQEQLQARQTSLSGARILLVEDNPINQELACDLLQRAGIDVVVAGDGREALSELEGERFDAVLMDCQMPVMDGYEATRELRLRPELKDLPVIAMTANAMAGDREKVLAAGMNDHIAKPVNVEELFATLGRWVSRRGREPGGAPRDVLAGLETRARLEAAKGREALYRRLLGKFLQREADFEVRLRSARANGDVEAAIRCAHDLNSVASTLGMLALQQAAEALETALVVAQEEGAAAESAIEPLLQAVNHQLEPLMHTLPEWTRT